MKRIPLLSAIASTTLLAACTTGNTSGAAASPELVEACKDTMRSTFTADHANENFTAEQIKRALEDAEKDCEDGIVGNGRYRD